MAEFDIQVEEFCLLYEYHQGTLFNGLEYFDVAEEELNLSTPTYIVFVDELVEALNLLEGYEPVHNLVILENLSCEELFGFPSQISATSLEVVHGQAVRPVEVCYFGLEVIHGVDIFWEELSSGLHSTSFAKGVPYHWFTMYESFGALDTDIIVKVSFAESLDRVNMRHVVEQLYNFNNFVQEQLFVYGWPTISWGKLIEDGWVFEDSLSRYLGFSVTDYLFTQTGAESKWIGKQTLHSNVFAYDVDKQIQGFSEAMVETINIEELIQAPFIEKIMGTLGISGDLDKTNAISTLMLKENFRVKTTVALAMSIALGVTDAMGLVDNFVLATVVQDYVETLQDGFGVSVDSAVNFVLSKLIEDSLTGADSPLLRWYIDVALAESIGFTEEIK